VRAAPGAESNILAEEFEEADEAKEANEAKEVEERRGTTDARRMSFGARQGRG
jgi:hypothetical protein